MLLYDFYAQFDEAMGKGVLVNLFQMPVPKVGMDVIARLPDHVAQGQYPIVAHQLRYFHKSPLPLCDFCGSFCALCGYSSYTFGKTAFSSRSHGARYSLTSSFDASRSPIISSFTSSHRTVRPAFMAMLARWQAIEVL